MFLKKFDVLSPNITLYYYNQKRHSSCVGGFLTIIMIIFGIYIIFQYSLIKIYPSSSSLLIYRNFEKEINIFFNKTGLFHYIWIFNEKYIMDNQINQNLIQLNNNKRRIIRIYMTYLYDKNDFNSSNLKDNDHWVYDTCSSYADEEDLKYDYSFSSCIKYYYNSNLKKYYSINDNENFKWPYIQINLSNFENIFFGIFVEKCVNNTILNEILGECYPDEKINEYLNYFNTIFLSFINCKIQTNNDENPVKLYSHKIYDNIIYDKIFFYKHDLTFIPFNYKGSKGIISKTIEYNSFMFDEDISKKIYNNNNKVLISYIFKYKKYINEFREKNNDILEFINDIGGCLFLIYILFYCFNYIINERIKIWNFQKFLNDKENDLIYRNINYEKSKAYSFKSNIYTNLSNDFNYKNDDLNKSIYLGKFLKNDLIRINNFTNDDNIGSKNNTNNNYTIKINKIDNEDKDMDIGKKSDNIIVINNNSFMNDTSNNKYITNSLEKFNSLKEVTKYNKFENTLGYHKIYTYNKNKKESPKINHNIKDNNLTFVKIKKNVDNNNIKRTNSKRNDSADFNSRQKIIDTSSVTLLNSTNQNKNQNLFINNSYNIAEIKETPLSNNDKTVGFSFFSKLNTKIQDSTKIIPRQKYSFLKINNNADLINNYKPKKLDKNINKTNITRKNKERRKSHQPRINLINEKDINERYKSGKAKTKKSFLKMPENRPERHLSLFSKYSYVNNNNNNNNSINQNQNEKNIDYNSQQISKSFIEQNKKPSPIHNNTKKIRKTSSELESRSLKKHRISTIKKYNNHDSNNQFEKTIQDYQLSLKNICNYIFLCKNRENNIYLLNNFRKKLLSEEYLYILHINMFIFKQKFGCKSVSEKIYLLEELYNDY